MSNENRTPTGPRGLTGPIYRGWSDVFFGRVKLPTAKTVPPTPDLLPSTAENPKPFDAGADQAAPTEAKATGEHIADLPTANKEPAAVGADESEATTGKIKRPGTPGDLIALVPLGEPISKNLLIDQWRDRHGNHQTGRTILKALITAGNLFEWRLPRARTNAAKLIARTPQPTGLNPDTFQKTFQTPNQ